MNNIKENREQRPTTIDYIVFRDEIADNRWVIKRLVVALIVAIALLFVSNMAWLYAWNQFDYSSETVTTTADSEGDGVAVNITGGSGGVNNYGQSDGDGTENNPNQANSNGNTQNANP